MERLLQPKGFLGEQKENQLRLDCHWLVTFLLASKIIRLLLLLLQRSKLLHLNCQGQKAPFGILIYSSCSSKNPFKIVWLRSCRCSIPSLQQKRVGVASSRAALVRNRVNRHNN